MTEQIKIFLASADDLAEERLLLGNFINGLNGKYHERGIFIKLLRWEDESKECTRGGAQIRFDELLKTSHFVQVLIHGRLGEFTKRELILATDLLNSSDLQKLVIGFKSDPKLKTALEYRQYAEVIDFKEVLGATQVFFDFHDQTSLEHRLGKEIEDFLDRFMNDSGIPKLHEPLGEIALEKTGKIQITLK